ncbi:MAG: hypothetical protein DRR42_07195 [Gammaproteobacteria bacterium]|nr:MAG: hypothetical protein DRR42_07195 [Gammaproteobacteria bacterium]
MRQIIWQLSRLFMAAALALLLSRGIFAYLAMSHRKPERQLSGFLVDLGWKRFQAVLRFV